MLLVLPLPLATPFPRKTTGLRPGGAASGAAAAGAAVRTTTILRTGAGTGVGVDVAAGTAGAKACASALKRDTASIATTRSVSAKGVEH